MKVWVVLCHYSGCEECGDDNTHIVSIHTSVEGAEMSERAHQLDKALHLHDFWTESVHIQVML